MDGTKTDQRVAVRVLLRGMGPLPEGTVHKRIGGYIVFLVSNASASRWPDVDVHDGDLEGITWTTMRQAEAIARNLEGCAGVVAAHATVDDE